MNNRQQNTYIAWWSSVQPTSATQIVTGESRDNLSSSTRVAHRKEHRAPEGGGIFADGEEQIFKTVLSAVGHGNILRISKTTITGVSNMGLERKGICLLSSESGSSISCAVNTSLGGWRFADLHFKKTTAKRYGISTKMNTRNT